MEMTVWSASRGEIPANELPGSDEVVWVVIRDDARPPLTDLAERIAKKLGSGDPSQEDIGCHHSRDQESGLCIPGRGDHCDAGAVHRLRGCGRGRARAIRIEPKTIVGSSDGTVVVTERRKPYSLSKNESSSPDWRPLTIDEHFLERTKRRWDEDLQRAESEARPSQARDLVTDHSLRLLRARHQRAPSKLARWWLEDAEIQAAPLFGDATATRRHAKDLIELQDADVAFSNAYRSLKAPADHESESWYRGPTER